MPSLWCRRTAARSGTWNTSKRAATGSRAVDPILDEKDPIPDSYSFEVCSAGLERELKHPSDFAQFLGSAVTVKLYKPVNGLKEQAGTLAAYEDGAVTIRQGEKEVRFEKSEVAQVRLRVEF